MTDKEPDWEETGHFFLKIEMQRTMRRLKEEMLKVGGDIADGEDPTAEDMHRVGVAFYEALHTINEWVLPHVENPDEIQWEFELSAQELGEMPGRSKLGEDDN